MTVEQTKVIDAIGIDNKSGIVVLTISDHLEWDGDTHLLQLQEKINTYLAFVESGEILSTYPDSRGRKVSISVVCRYPPNSHGASFLNRIAGIVDGAGISFGYRLFDQH